MSPLWAWISQDSGLYWKGIEIILKNRKWIISRIYRWNDKWDFNQHWQINLIRAKPRLIIGWSDWAWPNIQLGGLIWAFNPLRRSTTVWAQLFPNLIYLRPLDWINPTSKAQIDSQNFINKEEALLDGKLTLCVKVCQFNNTGRLAQLVTVTIKVAEGPEF